MNEALKVARTATILTIFLVVLKGIVGVVSNAGVLIVDALHSLSDVLLIASAWVGIKVASRPADKDFPYGYYRFENLVSLLLSIFIIAMAVTMIFESMDRLTSEHEIKNIHLALATALVSIGFSVYIGSIEMISSKKSGFESLKMNAIESFADAVSSFAVFISIALSGAGIYWVEGVVMIVIALIVIISVSKVGISSALALIDYSPRSEREKIERLLEDAGIPYRKTAVRRFGPHIIVDVWVPIEEGVKAREIGEMRKKILDSLRPQARVLAVHIIPEVSVRKTIRIAVPVESKDGKISMHFGDAPYFCIVDVDRMKKTVLKKTFLKNKHTKAKKKKGYLTAKWLAEEGVTHIFLGHAGEPAKNFLESKGIAVLPVKAEKGVDELVDEYLSEL